MSDKKFDLEIMRHSLSHVLAMAVVEMFPEAKLGIGPAIENGFYYDFDLPRTLIPEDLPLLEEKMRDIIKQDLPFEKTEVDSEEAIKLLGKSDQKYKLELVEDLKKEGNKTVSLYKTGDYVDLCAGPHVDSTSDLKDAGFKLDKIAGAYWKGSEKNKMLQRIYGLAFENREELKKYEVIIHEAEKRDHRKLGRYLELFFFDKTAPGMPYWLPKGLKLYNTLLDFWRKEHEKRGYQEIKSPLLNKKELYEVSGHWEHYKNDMFIAETEEKEVYGIKPMNCPNAIVVYKLKPRSYKELPLRFSDVDTLHRAELSGTLNGLFRVREFQQDDSHNFITEDQIASEYMEIFEIVERFYSIFNLEYSYRLGTRPEKYLGKKETWDKAEEILNKLLKKSGKKYIIAEGDGAFYGPKVDILMKDALEREWQMGTIQLDFQLPERFNLTYIDDNGKDQMPVIVHRVIYGSLERFIGILTEHYAGDFPAWLAPVQAIVLPISDKHLDYAKKVSAELKEKGIRVEIDERTESIGKKIRESEMQKIPYMLIVGDKECSENNASLRSRQDKTNVLLDIASIISRINSQSLDSYTS